MAQRWEHEILFLRLPTKAHTDKLSMLHDTMEIASSGFHTFRLSSVFAMLSTTKNGGLLNIKPLYCHEVDDWSLYNTSGDEWTKIDQGGKP